MTWFKSLRIRTRLLLAFGFTCLLPVFQAIMAHRALDGIEAIHDPEVDPADQALVDLAQVRSDENQLYASMLSYILFDGERAALLQAMDRRSPELERGVRKVRTYLSDHDMQVELGKLATVEEDLSEYQRARTRQLEASAQGRQELGGHLKALVERHKVAA